MADDQLDVDAMLAGFASGPRRSRTARSRRSPVPNGSGSSNSSNSTSRASCSVEGSSCSSALSSGRLGSGGGSSPVSPPARVIAAGRSQNAAATSRCAAQRIACHSGENTRERPERGPLRSGRRRRPAGRPVARSAPTPAQRDSGSASAGSLDQHDVGPESVERGHQRAGRTRAVVPDPEDLDAGHRSTEGPVTPALDTPR